MYRLLTAAILASALALPAVAQRDRPDKPDVSTLTVMGNGEIRAVPDEATVRLGVTQQARTAQEAQSHTSAIAQRILTAITGLGIKEEQVQTSDLQLFPIYAQQKPGSDEQPEIVAYRAENIVTIRLDQLSRAGAVIDAGLKAGANRLDSLSFNLRNDLPARQSALRDAIREARAKATAMADALDVRIVKVLDVQEGGAVVRPPVPMMATFARAADASTPVSPGQVSVSANVTIRYQIAPK